MSTAHAGLGLAVPSDGDSAQQPGLLETAPAVVPVEVVGSPVVGHEEVEVRVVVDIGPNDAQPVVHRPVGDAGRLRNVREGPVAVVPVEEIGRPFQAPGPASHPQPVVVADPVLPAGIGMFDGDVVGHEEVQVPVAVVVGEGAPGAEPGTRNSGPLGGLGEGPVPVVAIEQVGSQIGDVEVEVPVAVVVSRAGAHAPSPEADTRRFGDIGE